MAYINRGVLKTQLNDYVGAIADFDTAIELEPNNGYAHFCKGFAKEGIKDFKGAIADYTRAIETHPNRIEIYVNRK